jgi:hypothetical protein
MTNLTPIELPVMFLEAEGCFGSLEEFFSEMQDSARATFLRYGSLPPTFFLLSQTSNRRLLSEVRCV